MYTLTVGWLLYQATGSAAAFGTVIIVEYGVSFLLNFLAGPTVDRGNPKLVAFRADAVRGTFVIAAAIMIAFSSSYLYMWILASVIVINIAKPFYESAVFTIGPAIVPGELLTKYNSLRNTFFQIGQLLGVALAGPIIQYFGASVAFGLNGLSYLVAGLAILVAHVPLIEQAGNEAKYSRRIRMLFEDWREVYAFLRSHLALGCHIVICTGDFLAVAFLNLALVPMVDQRHGGNAYWLSVFDGSFAVGAVSAVFFSARVAQRLGARNCAYIGLSAQAVLFSSLAVAEDHYITVIIILGLGAMSAFSLAILLSTLQRRSQGPIRGRIASVRNLALAILCALLIPVVTNVLEVSLNRGLLVSAAICAAFGLVTLVLSRHRFFGKDLLGTDDNPGTHEERSKGTGDVPACRKTGREIWL